MNDDHSDSDLRETFARLRDQEATHAPAFRQTMARARAAGERAPAVGGWHRSSLAAGLVAVLVLLGLIRWIDPAPQSTGPLALSGELPTLLATRPADAGLFASLAAGPSSPTDSLLPYHLRFDLF